MATEKRKVLDAQGRSIGAEWQLDTAHGTVMVFQPEGYSSSDGSVLYVHGYFDTVLTAWKKHRLPEQFYVSGVKALFIAPEAPKSSGDSVKWASLSSLLDTVAMMTGVRPGDPVVAIGHSAAFETLNKWLPEPRLVHITLLDALYGFAAAFRDWGNQAGHTMTLLVTKSGAPRTNSEKILPTLFSTVKWAGVPPVYDDFSQAAKDAKTLYIVANESHMQLVEGRPGKPIGSWVIPILLRKTPLGGGSLGLFLLLGAALLGAAVLR